VPVVGLLGILVIVRREPAAIDAGPGRLNGFSHSLACAAGLGEEGFSVGAVTGRIDGGEPSGSEEKIGGVARPLDDPVFVLCMGRSGSTLLRFLLDAHPELACPPETNVPALCGQLSVVWSLIEGAALSAERDAAPPRVPDAAVRGIRRMVGEMTGSYLARRGKRLYCDKSLGSARFADLLVQVFPQARFVCLYRHPMDVIRSGLDACPFGLNGYGFDQYIVGSPGNAVLALARCWLDNATAIAGVEERYPDQCRRVRYEDLVEDPEGVMQEVYAFIGVGPAPGVAQACFSREREEFGPADHKIWATSSVSGDSVGRGESVPAALIPPPVTDSINELAARLGYLPVDAEWGTPGRPADPRVPDTIKRPVPPNSPADGQEAVPGSGVLLEFLRSRLAGTDERFADRWEPHAREKFLFVSRAAAGGGEAGWLVDVAARTVTADDGQAGDDDDDDGQPSDISWSVLGSPETWQAVMGGRLNLHMALRRCDVRYCPTGGESPLLSHTRIAMLADLFGLSSWANGGENRQGTAAPLAVVP
jgi:Sulfotransferase family